MIYAFENYLLDVERRELRQGGDLVPVEPGVFDLLQFLVHNRERVVSRDDLIAGVWNGRIVSESAVGGRINAARSAVSDSGEQQRLIRTVPRKGYRFVAAVREVPDSAGVTSADSPLARDAKPAALAGTAPSRLPNKPSIAVLPFTNMSGDPHHEYFSDGITEDIITELSRLRWFFVIARNSSFAYKGQALDAKDIGCNLGVRYILEGSVRKAGHQVRVTSQLVDVCTGSLIWAERYDRELTDIFAVQDEITARVAAAIEPSILAAEGMRAETRSVEDLGAWDLVARALWHFWRLTTTENELAITLLRQAVERYPNYAPAHSMLAFALIYSAYVGWTPPGRDKALAAQLARRAMELDEDDPRAHLALGYLAMIDRETDRAVRHIRVALTHNPNLAAAHRILALTLVLGGRPEEALRCCDEAFRMDPRDATGTVSGVMAGAHYQAGRYADAVKCAKETVERRPGFIAAHRILCASLGQAGAIEEAKLAMSKLRKLHPAISVAWVEKWVPYTAGPMLHFVDGLRKAGLPER